MQVIEAAAGEWWKGSNPITFLFRDPWALGGGGEVHEAKL